VNLIELSKYLEDEALAEKYLLENGILKTWTNCPHCNSDKLGRISRGRIKCYKCKKEWHKRKNSVLESLKLNNGIFIAAVKLFADGCSINDAGKELGVEKKTISRLFKTFGATLSPQAFNKKTFPKEFRVTVNSSNQVEITPIFAIDATNNNRENNLLITVKRKREIDNNYSFEVETKENSRGKKEFNQIDRFINFVNYNSQFFRGFQEIDYVNFLYETLLRFNNTGNDCLLEIIRKIANSSRVVDLTPPS